MKDDSYGLAPIKVTDSVSSPHSQRKENEMEEIKEGLKRILTDNMQTYEDKVDEILSYLGKQLVDKGRKEVVEWFRKYETCFISEEIRKGMAHTTLLIPDDDWFAKLKEWGL